MMFSAESSATDVRSSFFVTTVRGRVARDHMKVRIIPRIKAVIVSHACGEVEEVECGIIRS